MFEKRGTKPWDVKTGIPMGEDQTPLESVIDQINQGQRCLLDAAMAEEMKKPPHLRQTAFLIHCPCPKCNPFRM